jgi:hypothetical protein
MTLAIDDTETLTPEIQPWNASNQTVTWESSHPQYATVNPSTGEVTAVSEGSTTITVTTADGGKTASCIVTVSAALGLHLLDNTIDPKSILVEYTASAEQYARLLSSDYGFSADMVEITNTIYEKFEDDFDFIFYVLNEPESEEIIDRLGFYGVNMRVSNAVKGVGLSIGSSAENWGSAGKLKSVMYLPYNTAMSGGPTLHELAHNWAAFVVPTYGPNPDSPTFDEIRYDGHWGISNAGGQLGGFTEARVIEENSGSEQGKTLYQARYLPKEPRPGTIYPYGNFGLNANGGNSLPYSDIELYLMGMKSAEELSAANFTLDVYSGNSIEVEGDYPFGEGYFWSTTKTTYSINDIINYAGPRVPDANASQKEFKVLTVVLTQEGQGEDYYAEIIKDMSWLAGGMEDNTYPGRGIYNFQQATYGVGSLVVDGVKNSLKTEPTTRSATTRAILPSRDLRDRIHIDGLDENLLAPKR